MSKLAEKNSNKEKKDKDCDSKRWIYDRGSKKGRELQRKGRKAKEAMLEKESSFQQGFTSKLAELDKTSGSYKLLSRASDIAGKLSNSLQAAGKLGKAGQKASQAERLARAAAKKKRAMRSFSSKPVSTLVPKVPKIKSPTTYSWTRT